jgi:DNA polymerase-3 subunit delta'
VGRELAALGLCAALLCDDGETFGCGKCRSCARAGKLNGDTALSLHPDVVFVQRGLYPPAAIGRTTPESTSISVQQIRRVILSRVNYAPHEGRAQIFIIRDAHELTPSAANALLKSLEEPPGHTHFILLTNRPRALLDTIRSRTLAVRFGALSQELVVALGKEHGVTREIAALSQGSLSTAIELMQEETVAERERFADTALELIDAPDYASAIALAEQRAPDRHRLKQQLEYLAQRLALRASEVIATHPDLAERCAKQHQIVQGSLRDVDRNAQAALLIESMIAKLRAA